MGRDRNELLSIPLSGWVNHIEVRRMISPSRSHNSRLEFISEFDGQETVPSFSTFNVKRFGIVFNPIDDLIRPPPFYFRLETI